MPTSRSSVEAGDYILIPIHDKAADHSLKRVKLRWHQYFQTRNERYDQVMVKNTSHNPENEIHMFIQANWYRRYEDDTELPDQHLDNVAELTEDGSSYKLLVDCRLQYGQQDPTGKELFLVYQEKNRLPHQHRFPMESRPDSKDDIFNVLTTLIPAQLLALEPVQTLLARLRENEEFAGVIKDARNLVGIGLHTFQCGESQQKSHKA